MKLTCADLPLIRAAADRVGSCNLRGMCKHDAHDCRVVAGCCDLTGDAECARLLETYAREFDEGLDVPAGGVSMMFVMHCMVHLARAISLLEIQLSTQEKR